MTFENLMSVLVLDKDISEIVIVRDAHDSPNEYNWVFRFEISDYPESSSITFSEEIKAFLMPMMIEKAKVFGEPYCSLTLQISHHDIKKMFAFLKERNLLPCGFWFYDAETEHYLTA